MAQNRFLGIYIHIYIHTYIHKHADPQNIIYCVLIQQNIDIQNLVKNGRPYRTQETHHMYNHHFLESIRSISPFWLYISTIFLAYEGVCISALHLSKFDKGEASYSPLFKFNIECAACFTTYLFFPQARFTWR